MATAVNHERFWVNRPAIRGWNIARKPWRLSSGLGYIGGSFAAWMVSDINQSMIPNDIDIFATSVENHHCLLDYFEQEYGEPVEQNIICSTFRSHGITPPIQIIAPHPDWKVFPDDILNSFDLDVCRAVLIDERHILADINANYHNAQILGMSNPLRTLKRVIKYAKRGCLFEDAELCKLFQGWERLDQERRGDIISTALEQREIDNAPAVYIPFTGDDYWDSET